MTALLLPAFPAAENTGLRVAQAASGRAHVATPSALCHRAGPLTRMRTRRWAPALWSSAGFQAGLQSPVKRDWFLHHRISGVKWDNVCQIPTLAPNNSWNFPLTMLPLLSGLDQHIPWKRDTISPLVVYFCVGFLWVFCLLVFSAHLPELCSIDLRGVGLVLVFIKSVEIIVLNDTSFFSKRLKRYPSKCFLRSRNSFVGFNVKNY